MADLFKPTITQVRTYGMIHTHQAAIFGLITMALIDSKDLLKLFQVMMELEIPPM